MHFARGPDDIQRTVDTAGLDSSRSLHDPPRPPLRCSECPDLCELFGDYHRHGLTFTFFEIGAAELNLTERPEMGHIMNGLRLLSGVGIFVMNSFPSVRTHRFWVCVLR